MAKCPRCQRMFTSETGYCPNCGYQPGGQFSPGNDQTRSADENYPYLPVPPVGSGQSFSSPVPPLAAGAPFGSGNHPQSWQQPVYPGINPGQNQSAANYYSPQPGGEIPGGGREPRKKWYRKKQVLLPILIGVVVTIALVSGIAYAVSRSSKSEAPAASSPHTATTAATPTETHTPEVTRVELPADGGWQWQGGAMIAKGLSTGGRENPHYSFKVWTPKLKDKTVDCTFFPVQNGEKMPEEKFTDTNLSVTATYGDDPTVFVVYTVLNKAVGTSPETVHLYAQQIDLPSCEAKSRIDLQTEPDNVVNDRQDYEFEVIAKSESKIAVAKTWDTKTDSSWSRQGHVQVMAITAGENKAAALQEATGEGGGVATPASFTSDVYMIGSDKRRFYSIDSNKLLFELPLKYGDGDSRCYSSDGLGEVLSLFRLSADKYVYDCSNDGAKDGLQKVYRTYLVTAGNNASSPTYNWLKLFDKYSYSKAYYQQLKGGSLLVTNGDSYQAVHIGTNGKVSQVLDSAQWERLLHSSNSHFGLANYLNNQFYVQTTDEILTMDLTGKSVKTLEEAPDIVSLATDITKVNWIAWKSDKGSSDARVVLTTGELPYESETNQ